MSRNGAPALPPPPLFSRVSMETVAQGWVGKVLELNWDIRYSTHILRARDTKKVNRTAGRKKEQGIASLRLSFLHSLFCTNPCKWEVGKRKGAAPQFGGVI